MCCRRQRWPRWEKCYSPVLRVHIRGTRWFLAYGLKKRASSQQACRPRLPASSISVPTPWSTPESAANPSLFGYPAVLLWTRGKTSLSAGMLARRTGSMQDRAAELAIEIREVKVKRRTFLQGAAAAAGTAVIAKPAIAQAATEFTLFFPVAVGGPITKLIDTMAVDFEKENPSIKVKPVYAGTYQET